MALRCVSSKIDFDHLTLKFGKILNKIKNINMPISVNLQDNQMWFELLVTVSRGIYWPPTGLRQ